MLVVERHPVSGPICPSFLHRAPNCPGDTTVCTNTKPFNLFQVLKGFPDPGGEWVPHPSISPGFFNPAVDTAGLYTYIFSATSECEGDTAWVRVYLETPPELRPDTTLCYGDELRLDRPRELLSWEWFNGSQAASVGIHRTRRL